MENIEKETCCENSKTTIGQKILQWIKRNFTATIIGLLLTISFGIFSIYTYYKPVYDTFTQPVQLDFETATKLADERLNEEIDLRDKTIAALNEELARKNLPAWEQIVKEYLEKGELQKAIESIDPNLANDNEEAAQKHIRKAQLYIANFQFDEAEQHYQQAATIFPSYDNNFSTANFYYDLNKFPQAIAYYKRCLSLANSPEEKGSVLNNMGVALRNNNDYPEAKASFEEALKIHKQLADENPQAYLPDVAMTLNNLAVLHSYTNEYPQALKEYEEALEIYRKLADENPQAYLPGVAMTLNNLGILHADNNEYPQALKEYEEALEIRRKLADENPQAYLHYVATTLHNLGLLHADNNEHAKALSEYEEALEIRRKLADENPQAYLPDVAETLNNMAMFYQDDMPNKALSLKYAREAIGVLGRCNDTPFVGEELKKAKQVIEKWNAIEN